MSRRALILGLAVLAACQSARSPQLTLIGVHDHAAREVVFVQVTNPASHPMRLTRLEYTFAADGATISQGDVELARDIQPGSAVVVEVPLELPAGSPEAMGAMTLHGTLTTQSEQLVRTFPVSAQLAAPPALTP